MENARMSNAAALVTELWKTEYARGRQLIGNAAAAPVMELWLMESVRLLIGNAAVMMTMTVRNG